MDSLELMNTMWIPLLEENEKDTAPQELAKIRTIKHLTFVPDIVGRIFTECRQLGLPEETRILAVECYNRAMQVYFNDPSHGEFNAADALKPIDIGLPRLYTCMNIAIKFTVAEKAISWEKIITVLALHGIIKTKTELEQLEQDILNDMDYRLHKPTLYVYLNVLTELVVFPEDIDKEHMFIVLNGLLDFYYLNHVVIFERLKQHWAGTSLALRENFLRAESDRARMAAAIIMVGVISWQTFHQREDEVLVILNTATALANLTGVEANLFLPISHFILELVRESRDSFMED